MSYEILFQVTKKKKKPKKKKLTKIKYTCHTRNSQPENNVPELKSEC